jgi:hypothetical protein
MGDEGGRDGWVDGWMDEWMDRQNSNDVLVRGRYIGTVQQQPT